MEEQYNLIYNGKMLHGMDGYTTTVRGVNMSMDTSDKPVGCSASYSIQEITGGYGDVCRGYLPVMPYIKNDTYKLSFQFKDNGSSNNTQYSCFLPFDNLGKTVSVETVLPQGTSSTITTLTQDLNDGDYIIHVDSVANWSTAQYYFVIGVIESAAWKDDRALAWQYIGYGATIDTTNNTITLGMTTNGGSERRKWNGGTYKAGSKVRQFSSGSTYIYPILWNTKPTDWTYKEVIFTKDNCPNSLYRLPFTYFLGFGTIYTKGKFADLRLENVSNPQVRLPLNMNNELPLFANSTYGTIADYIESTSSINQYGQLNTGMLSEGFLPVRYIRNSIGNWTNGDNSGTTRVFCELQAFDRWGRNVAFAADGELPANSDIYNRGWGKSRGNLNIANTISFKPIHALTKGYHDSNIFMSNSGWIKIDMGIIHYINTIKLWHFADGRIYQDNIVEVSADGVNWITVFDSAIEGEYVETADGHTITFDKLGTLYHALMKKGGETLVQDIIED